MWRSIAFNLSEIDRFWGYDINDFVYMKLNIDNEAQSNNDSAVHSNFRETCLRRLLCFYCWCRLSEKTPLCTPFARTSRLVTQLQLQYVKALLNTESLYA